MIVHGGSPSPFARKVMVAMEEKGLSYENQPLVPFPKTPELLAMNPIGKIPILELPDGRHLPDSSVICAYLEKAHPEPPLLPADPYAHAEALFIEEYCDTKLNDAVSPVFFQRYVTPKVFGGEPDEAAVARQMTEGVEPVFDQVEGLLPDVPGPLLDAGFTLADVALGAQLTSAKLGGIPLDATRWPKIAAYADWILARPSFEKVMATLG